MKRRLISLVLVLMLVMTAGCGKKSTTKKLKTEDLDETTLQGMAKDITKEMSLKNKIGQLFMVSVYQLDEAESKNQTSVTSQMKKTLKKYPAGGVIMFAKNINTPDQTKKMTDELQDASYIPLFMAVDEEGGQVSRVASNPKMKMTVYPSAQEVGRTYNNKKIAQMGKTQGKELKELGFNMNLAPVADVLTNKNNTEIGDRSFGTDSKKVADIITTLVKNMQKQQISATLKHFPGSGQTGGDTHRGSTETDQTINALRDTVTSNKEKLTNKINDAKEIENNNYSIESWSRFEKALLEAIIVNEDSNATQEQVDKAYDDLDKAIKGLIDAPVIVDKKELSNVIETTNDFVEKDYTVDSWKAFKEALDYAKDVLQNENTTQDEVDQALASLQDAIKNLKTVSQTGNNDQPNQKPNDQIQTSIKKEDDNKTSSTKNNSHIKTGDDMSVVPYILLMATAGGYIALQRRNKED